MAQSSTLLSDCITRCIEQDTRENYEYFLQVFLGSQLGVILKGIPQGFSGQHVAGKNELTAAMGSTPDGKKMLLACADRATFVQTEVSSYPGTMAGRLPKVRNRG